MYLSYLIYLVFFLPIIVTLFNASLKQHKKRKLEEENPNHDYLKGLGLEYIAAFIGVLIIFFLVIGLMFFYKDIIIKQENKYLWSIVFYILNGVFTYLLYKFKPKVKLLNFFIFNENHAHIKSKFEMIGFTVFQLINVLCVSVFIVNNLIMFILHIIN